MLGDAAGGCAHGHGAWELLDEPCAGAIRRRRPRSSRYEANTLYVMNIGAIDVVDITNPASPTRTSQLLLPGEPTSVAVNDGLVAVSVPAAVKTDPGHVLFFRGSTQVGDVVVGSLPDMVTFTPDGKLLAVANEGEPNSFGSADSVDPEGSISVINTQPFRNPGALEAQRQPAARRDDHLLSVQRR